MNKDYPGTVVLKPSWQQLLKDPRLLLAFGFGSGMSPIMPGTMGTVAAIPLFLALSLAPLWLYVILLVAACLLGIHLCSHAAKELDVHDHPGIVWDEFAGYWLTMAFFPVSWQSVLAGFVIFRVFDMLKPWPIILADRHVHGGFGIMFDDILAGIASWISMYLLFYFGVLA